MIEDDYEDDDASYSLNDEGKDDVANWVLAAWDSGHFDWDLICGEAGDENIAERWRLAHWLNEMRLLDEPFADIDRSDEWDDETGALILLAYFFLNVREKAKEMGIRPTDYIEITFLEAEAAA